MLKKPLQIMQANAFLIAARSSSVKVINRLGAKVSSDNPLMACATSGSSWDANTTSSILSKISGCHHPVS